MLRVTRHDSPAFSKSKLASLVRCLVRIWQFALGVAVSVAPFEILLQWVGGCWWVKAVGKKRVASKQSLLGLFDGENLFPTRNRGKKKDIEVSRGKQKKENEKQTAVSSATLRYQSRALGPRGTGTVTRSRQVGRGNRC